MKNLLIIKTILFIIMVIIFCSCSTRTLEEIITKQHETVISYTKDTNYSVNSDYKKIGKDLFVQVLRIETPTKLIYLDSVLYSNSNHSVTYRYTVDNRRELKQVRETTSN
jgi:hypothetical protein